MCLLKVECGMIDTCIEVYEKKRICFGWVL